MKELLVLLEDQLHAREINLHILTGICAGLHRPSGATIADKMLFMVAAMAAEMERELIPGTRPHNVQQSWRHHREPPQRLRRRTPPPLCQGGPAISAGESPDHTDRWAAGRLGA